MTVKDTHMDIEGNRTATYTDDNIPEIVKTKLKKSIDDCLDFIMDKAMGDNVRACSIIASLITALSAKIANEMNETNVQANIDLLSEYMQIIVNTSLMTLRDEINDAIINKKTLIDNEKYI